MISKAILASPDNQLQLADIYAFIGSMFFPDEVVSRSRAWRNNVRHHLSVEDCFIKVGGRRPGCGSFWTVHPDCIEDFCRGDYRRRRWTFRRSSRPRTCRVMVDDEKYETMKQTILPSDELFTHLISSGVFARLRYIHLTKVCLKLKHNLY